MVRIPSDRVVVLRWVESILSLFGMAALQLAAFIVLAKYIGAQDYAVVVSVASVVTISVELVGLGTGDALVRYVSRDRARYAEAMGTAIMASAISLPIVAILSATVASTLGGGSNHVLAICALTTSELVSARSLAISEQVAMAHGRLRLANVCRVIPNLIRVTIVLISCLIFGVSTIDDWWPIQFAFGIFICPCFILLNILIFGKPRFSFQHVYEKRNMLFLTTQILRAVQMNIDKIIAGAFFSHQILANYGVASRLTQYALLPIQAALKILNPKFFREGSRGIVATRRLAHRMIFILVPVSMIISGTLYVGAPYFQSMIGQDFKYVTQMIQANCVLPVLLTFQYLLSDALTGADLANWRVTFLSVAVLLILAFSWIGAYFGFLGMIIGVILANAIFIVLLGVMLEILNSKTKKGSQLDL